MLWHLWRAVPFILFIALWQAVSASHLVNSDFLPSPTAVGAALIHLFGAHEIFANLGATVFTCFAGLAIGALIGIPLGAGMAISPGVEGFFTPLVKATYSLPKTALVPLLMLWFGIGGITNITVVVLAALLPLVVYTYHGVQGVPRVLMWSARAMGTPDKTLIWRVLLPASQQEILIGLRIALGFSFVTGISAEMIASTNGIGFLAIGGDRLGNRRAPRTGPWHFPAAAVGCHCANSETRGLRRTDPALIHQPLSCRRRLADGIICRRNARICHGAQPHCSLFARTLGVVWLFVAENCISADIHPLVRHRSSFKDSPRCANVSISVYRLGL
jgi:ABC-type nitrate/sulfonate/bicarbonate transport system permease component